MFEIMVPGRFPEMQLDQAPSRIQGYFKWELVRAGKVIRDSGGFYKNLITNNGLDLLWSDPFTHMNQAKVGTSPVAPAVTDNGCTTPVGTFVIHDSETSVVYVPGPPDYLKKTYTYKWLEANGNGNLTEIAIHTVGASGNCFTHQLFKDAFGVPTVITKTNLDQLFVTYEWRVYPPTVDVNSVIVVSGVNYDCTARPCNVTSLDGWGSVVVSGPAHAGTLRANSGEPNALVARNASPNVFNIFNTDATDLSLTPYVNGNHYVENKYVWDLGVANYATGIGLIALHTSGASVNPTGSYYQFVFPTTKFPKDNTKKLTLFIRKAWDRWP